MTRFPAGTGTLPMDENTLTAKLELVMAERDSLKESLSALVQHVLGVGGHMSPVMQNALATAIDVLGLKARTQTWRDR